MPGRSSDIGPIESVSSYSSLYSLLDSWSLLHSSLESWLAILVSRWLFDRHWFLASTVNLIKLSIAFSLNRSASLWKIKLSANHKYALVVVMIVQLWLVKYSSASSRSPMKSLNGAFSFASFSGNQPNSVCSSEIFIWALGLISLASQYVTDLCSAGCFLFPSVRYFNSLLNPSSIAKSITFCKPDSSTTSLMAVVLKSSPGSTWP